MMVHHFEWWCTIFDYNASLVDYGAPFMDCGAPFCWLYCICRNYGARFSLLAHLLFFLLPFAYCHACYFCLESSNPVCIQFQDCQCAYFIFGSCFSKSAPRNISSNCAWFFTCRDLATNLIRFHPFCEYNEKHIFIICYIWPYLLPSYKIPEKILTTYLFHMTS